MGKLYSSKMGAALISWGPKSTNWTQSKNRCTNKHLGLRNSPRSAHRMVLEWLYLYHYLGHIFGGTFLLAKIPAPYAEPIWVTYQVSFKLECPGHIPDLALPARQPHGHMAMWPWENFGPALGINWSLGLWEGLQLVFHHHFAQLLKAFLSSRPGESELRMNSTWRHRLAPTMQMTYLSKLTKFCIAIFSCQKGLQHFANPWGATILSAVTVALIENHAGHPPLCKNEMLGSMWSYRNKII